MPDEPDPDQTLFFKRRKQQVNFLPLIVVCALVLGSGALVVWAVSQTGRHSVDDLAARKSDARSVRRPPDDPVQRPARDEQPRPARDPDIAGGRSVHAARRDSSRRPAAG